MAALPPLRQSVVISSSVQTSDAATALGSRLEEHVDVGYASQSLTAVSLQALSAKLSASDLVVVILDPDDVLGSARNPAAALELGMAIGLLGIERTLIVGSPGTNLASDLAGLSLVTGDLDDAEALDRIARTVRDRVDTLRPRPREAKTSPTVLVSCARRDEPFAEKLATDLTRAGLSCWLDRKQLRPGAAWQEHLQHAITTSDRVLLVLSKESLRSDWVRCEVEMALRRQVATGNIILFVVIVDPAVFSGSKLQWPTPMAQDLQIADFSRWTDDSNYQRALRRLLQGLSISADTSA